MESGPGRSLNPQVRAGVEVLSRRATVSLRTLLSELRIVVVNGPRQAGKTTLLHSCRSLTDGTYLSLDDPAELAVARDDPQSYIRRPARPIIVDEVQRAGDPLVLAIKQAVDDDWSPGHFVLSGSTRFLSVPTLSESLAGRVAFVDLWPFAMSERTGSPGTFVDNAFAASDAVLARDSTWGRDDYIRLFCQGSFPEVLRLNAPAAITGWFRGYLDTVISRDIKEFAQVHRVQAIADLVALIAANGGSPLVVSRIANDLGIDTATVRTYLRYLETVFMVSSARAWSTNLSSRITRAPKAFVTDSGLAAHLLDVDADTLQVPGHPALGGLVETFVFTELTKLSTFATRETAVRHYRDRDQREVDFVLERRDGRVVAIEVKATATPKSEDARHLRWLRDQLGDRFVAGYLIHLGATNLASGERIYVTPLSALWDHSPLDEVRPSRP